MADVLDDGEFWLPPEFLTDDDLFLDKSKAENNHKNPKDGFGLELDGSKSWFPYEFRHGFGSFGFSSDLSSPIESVVGSTETESDEEDYLAGLTRQMAHSTLEDDPRRNDRVFASENSKGWVLSRSPQSTLCAIGSGCGCKQGSSRGSPNCQSRVSSPPGTWDLLYAAAGEVARMRMNEESYGGFNNRGLLGPPARKPSPNLDVSGYYPPHQSLSHQKLQAAQFQQLKQQQLMKQQNASVWGVQKQQHQHHHHVVQNRGRNSNSNRPLGLSPSAWPPLQQPQQQQQQPQPQNGSGMRAVFLGNPTAKRECAGTGVFLPRRIGTPGETRKKPACSTVLLPARVVQALNLNLDEIGAQPQLHPRFNASFTADSDAALRLRSGGNVFSNHKQRNFRPQQGMSQEVRLPQEWTY
ncbi:uncharacterized protein LOC110420335 [Herrania umbratica]|uniref:Uncharacterized protein LOC110420335 n=1 Tax=Herrania umbratica TaxID=108875 RepID=A0A6J1AR11_9ROSI|nr:uncharacterized protein LOC110420335 [Herrania umbratica]